jgi:hypothetical protein
VPQVLPIWEGSTNVMALDLLRALGSGGGGAPSPAAAYLADSRRRVQAALAGLGGKTAATRRAGESRLGPAVHSELLQRAARLLLSRLDELQPQASRGVGRGGLCPAHGSCWT